MLLLDEPFGALDARVRTELRAWLRRLHDETHTTTVIVTHDQDEAMEVADEVVVMNRGRVEQVAGPRELYDAPANEFVMSFVGQANRVGDAFVRPHDLELTLEPNGTTREAMIERIVHLGFEVRVDLVRDDGEKLSVQITRDEAERLELEHAPDRLRQPHPRDDVHLVSGRVRSSHVQGTVPWTWPQRSTPRDSPLDMSGKDMAGLASASARRRGRSSANRRRPGGRLRRRRPG